MLNPIIFLKSAYLDSYDNYIRSVKSNYFPHWDYICLTSSNNLQKTRFEEEIKSRDRLIPSGTKIIIVPDKDNERIGSGGATLSVIKTLFEIDKDFAKKRILVIHSGGDSKRVPQYSAIGKLFSPVPHLLKNGRLSTLFDEILFSMSTLAGRLKSGMVLLSGDVLLLYNALQIELGSSGAACITFKENVNVGKNHGVFKVNNDGFVESCYQKLTINELKNANAVDEKGNVNIDTGALYFGTDILNKLYTLVDTKEKYDNVVNSNTNLCLYTDLIYPFTSISLEEYLSMKSDGIVNADLLNIRKNIWELLCDYKLKAFKISPSKFVHFGTSKEIINLLSNEMKVYSALGWNSSVGCSFEDKLGYNSVASKKAIIGKNTYLENSYVHSAGKVGSNCILSYIDIHDEIIPDNIIIHGLKLSNGKFVVRIIGIDDNPKLNKFFGKDLTSLPFGISDSLWNLKVFPVKDTISEALKASLNVYDIANGAGDIESWKAEEKISLKDGFNMFDPISISNWEKRQQDLVKMDQVFRLIQDGENLTEAKKYLNTNELSNNQLNWLETQLGRISLSEKLRLYTYLSYCLEDPSFYGKVFSELKKEVINANRKILEYKDSLKIINPNVFIKLPLRVNFGGGWTDTYPYAIENGGSVLNAAISLNGELPVQVSVRKINERKIIFESKDMGAYGEFVSLNELQNTGDPYDKFALQKAALLSIGLIPFEGGNIEELFDRLDGGFVLDSEVIDVPKGSGLGTSSILSCAVTKALFEFFGIEYTNNKLYQTVILIEQIMSTGGGWQDQIGGATNGFKFISSKPGLSQDINVEHLELSKKVINELNNRFVLIYTGERRLARNLLRDVITKYLGNDPESLEGHSNIKQIALDMKQALLSEDVDKFIKLYDKHYSESLKIDRESTNSLIENIFMSIEDLIDARMIVGAGGGGFIAVFMKKVITKEQIHNRLREVFLDYPVDIWDSKFIF